MSSLPREAPHCGRLLEHGALSVDKMEALGTCTRVSFVQVQVEDDGVDKSNFWSLNLQCGWGREIFSILHLGVDASSRVRCKKQTRNSTLEPLGLVTSACRGRRPVGPRRGEQGHHCPRSRMGSMECGRGTSQPTTAALLIIRGAASSVASCLRRRDLGAPF